MKIVGLVAVLFAVAPVFAGPITPVFAVGNDSSLYTIDLGTGVLTLVGSAGATIVPFLDIAYRNGLLLGPTQTSNAIFGAIDPTTGNAIGLGFMGANVNALVSAPDGSLYGAGAGNFFSVDPATGFATQIGAPGTYHSSGDLEFLNGILYLTSSTANPAIDQLYTIDPLTGAATSLPNAIGFPLVYGLAAENGILYGFSNSPGANKIITIDPFTGVGTFVTNFDSTGGFQIYGTAVETIPEPGTCGLMGLGLAAAAVFSRRWQP